MDETVKGGRRMFSNLEKQITGLGLDAHREVLLSIARPAIYLLSGESSITPGCSKFGGSPDLPGDFVWPEHSLGQYRFIGQIQLADLPKTPHSLPETGLLSFFYTHDKNSEAFWQDPDYVRAYYFHSSQELRSMTPPEAVNLGVSVPISRCIASANLPPWPEDQQTLANWPMEKSLSKAYWELRFQIQASDRYLLGYPFNTTLGYDPTPGPAWTSLLTLYSNDDLEWCWHDFDWLVCFIEKQKLQAGDFSLIKSDAG